MNTKQQGDVGVAATVLHYTKLGYTVSQPLSDNSRYDLIVDKGNGQLQRVQCKTSRYFRDASRTFEVKLATSGGNKSGNTKKPIDSTEIDIVMVYTWDGDLYEFPAEVLHCKDNVRLGKNKQVYRVKQ